MLHKKEDRLRRIFKDMGSSIVAFSGGVDSACLALVAHQELGSDTLAVTAQSPSCPTHQRKVALDPVRSFGFRHEEMPALTVEMFDVLGQEFKRIGFQFVAVDVQGYRSGALNEVLTTLQVSPK
jgi:PP-loop superfamily ATP-utilizing enzyme